MKKSITLIITLLFSLQLIFGQTLPDPIYVERMFYTCKAWGHMKYYHGNLATGSINWDSKLVNAIPKIRSANNNLTFNDSLLALLSEAGIMIQSAATLPILYDSLNNNKDLSWINSSVLSTSVSEILDSVYIKFRPQSNYYVGAALAGNSTFDTDNLFNAVNFPSEEIRLLALFRYWNIINYFFPYKYIMDQDWDTTLMEFIPKVISCTDAVSYNLVMKELTTRINDSHAFFASSTYNLWRGNFYAPFQVRFIENETVITKVLNGISGLEEGDVIKKIDGMNIYLLRDSMEKYVCGSNQTIIERNINDLILWGPSGVFDLEIETSSGVHSLSLNRTSSNYNDLLVSNSEAWRDTIIDGCTIGIIDMGLLTSPQVDQMFNDLWNTDGIVFDIRNYPNGTLWDIVDYLYSSSINIANFTAPDIDFPGRLFWTNVSIGTGTPNPYQGNIAILFDERTQSHAEYTCMGLEQFPNAKKIGSTTAAADGNISYISLPGGISTYATFLGTYYPDYGPTQRVGIIPDVEVLPTIQGIRDGKDEVMVKAFEILNCNIVDTSTAFISLANSNLEVKFHPNPVIDNLQINCSTCIKGSMSSFEVIDIFGRTLISKEINLAYAKIDLSNLNSGSYFVKFEKDSDYYVEKIVKND